MIKSRTRFATIGMVLVIAAAASHPRLEAAPINITSATQFRDIRSANSVNFAPGDIHVLDMQVDNPIGTTGRATQGSFGFDLNQAGDFPQEFARNLPFGSIPLTPWTMTARNGSDVDVAISNNLTGVPALPFVRNLQLIPNGLTPTLKWEIPPTAPGVVQSVFIGYFDDRTNARLSFGGGAAGIFVSLPANATSFTFPAGLLEAGVPYVARVFLEHNLPLESRATTFVNFTAGLGPTNPVLFLPTVDSTGIFHFDFDITAHLPVTLDPSFASGYDFATGVGNPNFESVTLPAIGDGVFELSFVDATTGLMVRSLAAGVPFVFPGGGVSAFKVRGIELSAGLDPTDVTAFMTTVAFVDGGVFTGTMTPFIEAVANGVPEPATLILLALGSLILLCKCRTQMKAEFFSASGSPGGRGRISTTAED